MLTSGGKKTGVRIEYKPSHDSTRSGHCILPIVK